MTELVFNLPEKGEARSASDLKIREGLGKTKEAVNVLAGRQQALTWYEPKVITTEQSTSSTTFTTLSTADEVTGVVVPTNGIMVIRYVAQVKNSVANAGEMAPFIGATQIPSVGAIGFSSANTFFRVRTTGSGMASEASTPTVTTGKIVAGMEIGELAAGTYSVSVRYRASSGTFSAKERILWVEVYGS